MKEMRIRYDGYEAHVEYDSDAHLWTGEVTNIEDTVVFVADNEDRVMVEFQAAVRDYIDGCKDDGAEPEKPE